MSHVSCVCAPEHGVHAPQVDGQFMAAVLLRHRSRHSNGDGDTSAPEDAMSLELAALWVDPTLEDKAEAKSISQSRRSATDATIT